MLRKVVFMTASYSIGLACASTAPFDVICYTILPSRAKSGTAPVFGLARLSLK
jgi:hypothetical protein